MINGEAYEVIKELFDSLKNRYQNNLESMKSSEFVFDYVKLLYYNCHKVNPNRGGSYIDSLDWILNKKATTNPINKKDNKWFQYPVTVALNYEEIKTDLQRITKVKPFINKYNWEGINFSIRKRLLGKIWENNVQVLLIFCMLKIKKCILLMFKNITQIFKNKLFF